MIMKGFLSSTFLALSAATGAMAQVADATPTTVSSDEPDQIVPRLGPTQVTGECETWDVGFEYESCRRVPFPGGASGFVQVYEKTDGQKANFMADPMASAAGGQGDETPVAPGPAPVDGTAQQTGATVPASIQSAQPVVIPDRLPTQITIFPGRTELLPVAVGHLNRFETPFEAPTVRTSANESTINLDFDQNFVYVEVTEPATLYIHERGHPDPAIVVSLIPRLIAPRQVRLSVPANLQKEIDANRAADAKAVASALPVRVATAKGSPPSSASSSQAAGPAGIMQSFGRGQVPAGFKQQSAAGFNIANFCSTGTGVNFSLKNGRAYASGQYVMLIAQATASRRVELQEIWCAANPATVAVAFATRPVISKGKPTEVLILLSQGRVSKQ